MGWNPSLHPRGPNGRFTKSFAKLAGGGDKKRIAAARKGFSGRPPFRSPGDAHGFLSGMSAQKSRQPGQMDAMLAQLRAANQTLRSGKPDPSGFKRLLKPTSEDVTVYRTVPGQKFGGAQPGDLKGFVVKDAGYFPTSLAPTKPQPGDVRMRIDVPKGTNAAASPDSSELVLDAGIEMSVDEVTTGSDGTAEMHLTALVATDAGPATGETPAGETTTGETTTGAQALAAVPTRWNEDPQLTPEQTEALVSYMNLGYGSINSALRGGQFDPRTRSEEFVGRMDELMDGSRITEPVEVHRGLNGTRLFGDRLGGDLTGMQWREDAYVSTSADQSISEEFADGQDEPVMMRVSVPAGIGALVLSGDDYESEVLLQRGLTLRVTADNGVDAGGVRRIDVEVVPIDAPEAT